MKIGSLYLLLLAACLLVLCGAQAQLCTGSLGDPVVNITFGAGGNPGPQLNAAATNYLFYSTDCPNDGQYAIRSSTGPCFENSFHNLSRDHTGNANGYFMMVNASYQPGDFYLETVNGLCGNTTYEFAAWVLNILQPWACEGNGIKPNLTFSIETTNGTVLARYETGNIPETSAPVWKQYGMFFTTPANITGGVVLRITNNAPGGCGNDLVLDDITFRPCGAQIEASITGAGNATAAHFCEGAAAPVFMTAKVSAGYNAPSYQWQASLDSGATWNNIAGAITTSFRHTDSEKGEYLYRMTVGEEGNTATSCRIASNMITVAVHSKPALSFTPLAPACEGVPATISVQASLFSPPEWTHQWRLAHQNNGEVSFSETPDTLNGTSLYTLTIAQADQKHRGIYALSVTNAYGCTNSDSVTLLVNERPQAQFSAGPAACAGSPVRFTDASVISNQSITGWNWQFGNAGNATVRNPSFAFGAAGTFPVQLIATSSQGCSDTVTKDVVVHPLPQVRFGLPEICLTDPFALFPDSSAIADGTEAAFTYLWNFGDPSATPANPNTSTQKAGQHKFSAVGHYPVRLRVTSAAGCVADTVQQFTVNGAVPKAAFSLASESAVCSRDSIRIRNHSTVDFGSVTKVAVYWKGDNDPAALTVDEHPEPGKEYAFLYDAFARGNSGKFTIRFVAYSGMNCVSESYKEVTVNKSPQVVFDTALGVCAEMAPFLVTQASETAGVNGQGFYSGTGITGSGLFAPALAGTGTHLIRYTFTTDAGCRAIAENNFVVYPQPVVDAGGERTVVRGGSLTLQATASGGGLTYAWSPATYLNDPQSSAPITRPEADVVYAVTVRSADGCTDTDEVAVKVVPALYIPNAFTPNGDGLNDTWQVPYLESFPGASVKVFNRYGQLVHQAAGGQPWNGLFKGKEQPAGVYVYLVDLKNGMPKRKGTVLLIR